MKPLGFKQPVKEPSVPLIEMFAPLLQLWRTMRNAAMFYCSTQALFAKHLHILLAFTHQLSSLRMIIYAYPGLILDSITITLIVWYDLGFD